MIRFNAQRPTPNTQFRQLGVGCWMLDVFASMKSKRIVVMGFVAAGAVVTKSVPANCLVAGKSGVVVKTFQ
jgi:hypothetical protein